MASWDSYIKNLMDDGIIEEAAICGMNPPSVWAKSPQMSISVEEIKKLLADRSGFAQCGPCISGVKCRMLRDNMDDEGIFTLNLKTASDAEGNTYSVSVGKTLQTLVIGKGKKDANGGQVASKVFATVEHLRKANY
ncbi:profilin-1 [Trachinotus anak]|uniref:profilin-1 n=1 Tax=Trachinotus anak TaxID=443729 RepID=UPI0039F17C97